MSTLRDGYMNGISNTDMVSAAKERQANQMRDAAKAGYGKGMETNDLTSQMAYEQGMTDQMRRLAELQQFNGMQAGGMSPGEADAAAYERQLRLRELVEGGRLPEIAPEAVEGMSYQEAIRQGYAK